MQSSTKTLRVDPFRPEFHPVCESQSSGRSLSNTSTMCQWATKNSELEVGSDTRYWSRTIQNLELEHPILIDIHRLFYDLSMTCLWLFYEKCLSSMIFFVNLSTQLSQDVPGDWLPNGSGSKQLAFRGATSSKGHFSRITTSLSEPRISMGFRHAKSRISKPRNHKKP